MKQTERKEKQKKEGTGYKKRRDGDEKVSRKHGEEIRKRNRKDRSIEQTRTAKRRLVNINQEGRKEGNRKGMTNRRRRLMKVLI